MRVVDLGVEVRALVGGGAAEQLASGGEVVGAGQQLVVRGDDRFELAVPLRHDAQLARIGGGGGIGEACLELAELVGGRGEAAMLLVLDGRPLGHDGSRLPAERPCIS